MSLRRAITAKCRDCIFDELAAGSAAVQVELCPSWDTCPLWPVRAVRPAGRREPYSAAVRAEYGLTEGEAAFRLAQPFTAPPQSLCASNSGASRAYKVNPHDERTLSCPGGA